VVRKIEAPETEEERVPRVNIMAYNIWEGVGLRQVAETIRHVQPDIVLLNEVRWYVRPGPTSDQARFLAQQTLLRNYVYRRTTLTGIKGSKGVAILSRYPLLRTRMHMVRLKNSETSFGTLQATIRIDGLDHEVFSTRFAPMHPPDHPAHDPKHEPENRAGHLQAIELVRSIPPQVAVIFGGDFNASWEKPWSTQFRETSGLTDVLVESPDTGEWNDPADRVDYIYYRGPYRVFGTTMRWGWPGASDHKYVSTVLMRTDLPSDVRVPDVGRMSQEQAAQAISTAGLQPAFTGATGQPGAWVSSQSPTAGSLVSSGSTVTLHLALPGSVIVPEVREMLEGHAAQEIRDAGLQPRFTGSTGQPGAWVWSQSPLAGSTASPASTVTCQLRTGPIP